MISSLPAITKAADSIRRGVLTPSELVEFCLNKIRLLEPQVRAWVSVDETGARQEADRLSELAKQGEFLGPLHGIPVGIKDIMDVAGWPTKCGSPLRENSIAAHDAAVVRRLRDAGAIILGKTVTTEFASFDPPPTRNPWNLECTPGGSSSGSAAAVSTEMCVAALGSQTGGSIIRPASYCGIVGFKPTFGAVSLEGIEPLSWNLDHAGPMTRCVADATILFQVIREESLPDRGPSTKPVLKRLGGFFETLGDDAIRSCFAAAIDRLASRGITFETAKDSAVNFPKILQSHRRIMAVEAATHHRPVFEQSPNRFGPWIRKLIEEGMQLDARDYAAALRHQVVVQAELAPLFADGPVLAMPSTTTPAPNRETTGDPAFNSPWSFARLPTITIPCGLTPQGLPCGIQLVGQAGSELNLLQVAKDCEDQLEFHARPPLGN